MVCAESLNKSCSTAVHGSLRSPPHRFAGGGEDSRRDQRSIDKAVMRRVMPADAAAQLTMAGRRGPDWEGWRDLPWGTQGFISLSAALMEPTGRRSMRHTDIAIAGGGLAGSTAAAMLGRAG